MLVNILKGLVLGGGGGEGGGERGVAIDVTFKKSDISVWLAFSGLQRVH